MPASRTSSYISPDGLEKRTYAFYGHATVWERRLARDDCHRLEWGKYGESQMQPTVAQARIAGLRLDGWQPG